MNLYRLTDPNRPPSCIITLGRDKSIYSHLTRPVNR
jgi:hypothetical protein